MKVQRNFCDQSWPLSSTGPTTTCGQNMFSVAKDTTTGLVNPEPTKISAPKTMVPVLDCIAFRGGFYNTYRQSETLPVIHAGISGAYHYQASTDCEKLHKLSGKLTDLDGEANK